ncbi:PROTEIN DETOXIFICATION [Salix purpurea]|uniref:PROTEIN DETOXIFICATION n=1 Tax=Salix purpurea TaxID=77065 RepID=A0A9Q0Z9I9_SALPP|nr:PROTEIN DETOXIFICATION [Salix purpurea]
MEWQVHWKLYVGKLMELNSIEKSETKPIYGAMFSLVLVALAVSLVWINMEKLLIVIGQDPIIAHEAGKFTLWLIPTIFAYAIFQPLSRYLQVQSITIPMLVISVPSSDKHGDREEIMEESLLPRERDEKQQGVAVPTPTQGVFIQEVKRLGYVAGPMVAVILTQNCLQLISIMMCGHLGELALSSTAIAISLSTVTGFSLMVTHPYYYS